MSPATLSKELGEAAARLQAAGVERPRWTAAQIIASVLGCEPVALVVDPQAIGPAAWEAIQRRLTQRAEGIPLQYVTGVAGFFGREFAVRPGVFIPRPETERLVEVAARELARLPVARPVVIDVGTGSGAVAISLTLACPVSTIAGFDISRHALAVAQENARRLGVAPRLRWVCADLLAPSAASTVDGIVANLPYIPSSAISGLPREVQRDPPEALDGGPDGLGLIRRLLAQAAVCLRPQGIAVLEVGAGQASLVRRAVAGRWGACEVILDDTGVERVVVCRHPVVTRHG